MSRTLVIAGVALVGGSATPANAHSQEVCTGAWTAHQTASFGGVQASLPLNFIHDLAEGRDGNLYLAQSFSPSIEVVDGRGRPVRTIGRFGSGPGEFSSEPRRLGFRGDTLWVGTRDAVHFLGRDGVEHRRVRFRSVMPEESSTFLAGAPLADGSFLGYRMLIPPTNRFYEMSTGALRRFSDTGTVLDTIAVVESVPKVLGGERRGGGEWELSAENPVGIRAQPLASSLPIAVSPDGTWVASVSAVETKTAPSFQLTRIQTPGGIEFKATVPYEPRAITRSERTWLRETFANAIAGDYNLRPSYPDGPEHRERRRRLAHDALTLPDHYPPVRHIVAGADGTVWLQRETAPLQSDLWEAWGPDGERLGSVSVGGEALADPQRPWRGRMELHWATADHWWVVTYDDFDVPTVRRFAIERQCAQPLPALPL